MEIEVRDSNCSEFDFAFADLIMDLWSESFVRLFLLIEIKNRFVDTLQIVAFLLEHSFFHFECS